MADSSKCADCSQAQRNDVALDSEPQKSSCPNDSTRASSIRATSLLLRSLLRFLKLSNDRLQNGRRDAEVRLLELVEDLREKQFDLANQYEVVKRPRVRDDDHWPRNCWSVARSFSSSASV